ncbi:hypothetical protein BDY21DRAFT_282753 [Lineolata rhizophorae]|uniref:DUF676 domain-containing protein n=1 Tax=Lineolata rhizophorae TaxID=578093 RepID=A0A6A6P4F5_9PEZI|nr:hypothetical protein BDY21DRAFT_282753 [Lineolata rhizophorae]
MASRRVPRTFRATNVPCSTSKSSLEAAVCTLCDPTEKDSIKIRTTIAPSCTDAKRSQTAIITFDPSTPQKLAQASKVYIIVDGADVEIDSDFFGLTQLYPPRGKKVSADIVAVTGLNGHAFGSWSGGPSKKMWLRDFLCEDDVLKTCRTMIFGYNSKLRDAADHSMFEYVRSFLGELSKARSSEEERRRPIIFIGHSFGGNIITHSLPYAKTYESDAKICSIVKATYGMHFFGVPHNGIALDDVVDMVKDGSKPERVELVNEIINTAKSLTFPKENFKNMATNLKIVSFYETNMTKKVIKVRGESGYGRDGDHIMVVKRESAVLGLPSSIETAIPVDENHSSMVKFPTRTNKTYEHVRSFLQDWVKAAEKVVSERFGMLVLEFPLLTC